MRLGREWYSGKSRVCAAPETWIRAAGIIRIIRIIPAFAVYIGQIIRVHHSSRAPFERLTLSNGEEHQTEDARHTDGIKMRRNVPPRTFLGKVPLLGGKFVTAHIHSLRAYAFVANSICRGSYIGEILFEKARLSSSCIGDCDGR
jgi:hypothetical protein